jgi:iron complex outermembrane recepter protein
MKSVSFFLVVVLLAVPCFGQDTGAIKGMVSLSDRELTLPHVTVLISQLGRSVETGDDGSFEFQNVPPGRYDLVVSRAGLSSLLQTVEVTAGQTATTDFKMSLSPIRQEITVTATGTEVPTFESFQTVSTLDSFALAERAAPSVGEVLDNQPGVAKRSFGPGTARPVIRGFDGDRVLIMEDGVRTGSLSSQSGDHAEPIDVMSIERLEVVKGPATLLYGSNAIGGVVNAVSRHFQMKEQSQDGIRGYLSGTLGSNNTQGNGSTGFELGNHNWMGWANASHQKLYDYKAGGGDVVLNSGARLSNGGIGLGWFGDRAFTSAGYNYSNGIWGIPFTLGDDELVRLDFFKRNARLSGGIQTTSPLHMFRYDFNYSGYVHKEINFIEDEPELGTTFNNKQYTYQFAADHRAAGRLNGTFGFYGMHRNYTATGEEALTPPTKGNVTAVFGLEEVSFDRFKLQFGGRLEDTRYEPNGLEKTSFTGLSASAGIHVPLWQNGALVTNFTHSYRAPALEELYNDGPHPGNLVFEVGDRNLRREKSDGIDVSLRHVADRIRAEANFYYYDIGDFVFLDVTDDEEDGLPVAFYRQNDAKYTGTELILNASLHSNIWIDLGLDYVRAELKNSNTPLPRIPPLRSHIGIEGRYRGLSVKPEIVLADRQDRVFTNEDPTAGFAVFNINASYTLPARHFSHHFAFTAFNLGDVLYRNHLSFINSVAPEIGRGAKLTYSLRFF